MEAGRPQVFIGEALGDFLSQDHNIRGSLNAQPNLPAADFQHYQPDVVADQNTFANLAGKYQHRVTLVEVVVWRSQPASPSVLKRATYLIIISVQDCCHPGIFLSLFLRGEVKEEIGFYDK